MAEDGQANTESKKGTGSIKKLILWLLVITFSIGGGFVTPILMAQLDVPKPEKKKHQHLTPDPNEQVAFINFPEVVAVLGKSKFSRYLRIVMTLQVAQSQRAEVEAKIAAKTAVLRNRILMHISEITEEDLAGKHGHNQLRRQIHAFFNEILFDDGIERIQDVLFTDLQVN